MFVICNNDAHYALGNYFLFVMNLVLGVRVWLEVFEDLVVDVLLVTSFTNKNFYKLCSS